MCGRYLITSAPEAFRRLFGYPEQPNFPPRYNVAPTQPVPIVRLVEGKRQFALVRWGLIPAWVKDPRGFTLLVNARGESVNDKPAFRNAMKRRRCLFPADGFYEWMEQGGRKRPFVVRPKDGEPVAFAGLWETWMGPNGEEIETAAIVTTEANRDADADPSPHAGGRAARGVRHVARLRQRRRRHGRRAARAGARGRDGGLRDFDRGQPRRERQPRRCSSRSPRDRAGAAPAPDKPAARAKKKDERQPSLFD